MSILRPRARITNGLADKIDTFTDAVYEGPIHVVYTRTSNGVQHMYVNGVEIASASHRENLSSWVSQGTVNPYALRLASEIGGYSAWIGEYHLVAIYGRALSAGEVGSNYDAGPQAATPDFPELTINDVTVDEGDVGITLAEFEFTLSEPPPETVTVNYATADGSATAADNDYEATSGVLTFPAGAGPLLQVVTVNVNGDSVSESDETFTLEVTGSSNVTLLDVAGHGTIRDDDTPMVSINDVSITEGNSGQKSVGFNVSLDEPSASTVTVNYATADGTATTGGGDYVSASGTLTFSPFDQTETINVLVNGDPFDEGDETFVVNLSVPVGAVIADGQGEATILDDGDSIEPPPTNPAGYRMLEADGTVHVFGSATRLGDPKSDGIMDGATAVAMATTPSGQGYNILLSDGRVIAYGDAPDLGGVVAAATLGAGEGVAAISLSPTGAGYWVFTNLGQVVNFGDAVHFGDLPGLGIVPFGDIVASVAVPNGSGYYMLGADGGVFAFPVGVTPFHGSIPQVLPGVVLDCPIVGLVPTPTSGGYWMVACDGGVFAFGDAFFVGSLPGINVVPFSPVNGLVAFGSEGYLMVASDGGAFNFGSPFFGSLGATPTDTPVIAITPFLN